MGTMVAVRVGPLVILSSNIGRWRDYLVIPIMTVVADLPALSELIAKDKEKVVKETSVADVDLYHLPKASLVE